MAGRRPPRSSIVRTSAPAGCNRARALLRVPAAVAALLACGLLLWRAPAQDAASQSAAPPPDLAQLDFLLGDWTGTGTLTFGTREQKVAATLSVRRTAGGHFLCLEETLTSIPARGAEPVVLEASVMLVWYDATSKQFFADAFSRADPPRHGAGRWHGGVLSVHLPSGDAAAHEARLRTFSPVGRRELRSLGEHTTDGKHWGIVLTAKYRRATAP